MDRSYVHGYEEEEGTRLQDQAATLAELLHSGTGYPPGSRVLEAGCGVGAQTRILTAGSPEAQLTSIDISEESLAEAKANLAGHGTTNVEFLRADILDLPFSPETFDHVFVCFVLEHLPDPDTALQALMRVLKPGGTLTAIEGDHGSTFFYPDSEAADRAVGCLVELQRRGGGDGLIGRSLYPLFSRAGLHEVRVSPRMVYADATRPELVDGFTRKTFAAMVEGVRKPVVAAGLMTEAEFNQGVRDLYRAAEPDGVFCYTFFKATAVKPG